MTAAPATVDGAYPRRSRTRVAGAIVGACVTALVAERFGPGADALLGCGTTAVLVLLAVVDIEERRIPNVIVLPSAGVALVAHVAVAPDRSLEWILGAALTPLFLLVPAALAPGSVGMGDVKLGLLLGATLGLQTPIAFVIAGLASVPVAVIALTREGKAGRKRTVPFGPFLAAGAIATLLLGGSAGFS